MAKVKVIVELDWDTDEFSEARGEEYDLNRFMSDLDDTVAEALQELMWNYPVKDYAEVYIKENE